MKKIKIELDMLRFTSLLGALMAIEEETLKNNSLNSVIFREALRDLENQFSKQYTDEHGKELRLQKELKTNIYQINLQQ